MLTLLGAGHASVGGFSPLSLSPALWLKADVGLYQERTGASATTPAVSDGDPVGSWLDQSGNSRHVIGSADSKRPTLKLAIQNGLSVVRFDGTDDFLQSNAFAGDLSQPNTIFLVCQYSNQSSQFLCDGREANKRNFLMVHNAGSSLIRVGTDSGQFDPLATTDNTFQLLAAEYNGASSKAWKNGGTAQTGNPGTEPLSGVTIAARFSGTFVGNCDIAEYLLFNSSLSSTDFDLVRTYLNTRWAIY